MTTIILTLAFFALSILGLSVGAILKKRNSLKGSCHSAIDDSQRRPGEAPPVCDTCTCHAPKKDL